MWKEDIKGMDGMVGQVKRMDDGGDGWNCLLTVLKSS